MKFALLKPRYWGFWLLLGLVRLLAALPYRVQLFIGLSVGHVLRILSRRRWRITLVNIEKCLPELDATARKKLARAHFESLSMGFLEFGMCWWASERKLRKLCHIEGLENLQAALAEGRGVILQFAHFTPLEITAHMLAFHTKMHIFYRAARNPVLEHFTRRHRERQFERAIPRQNIRQVFESLKQGNAVLYANDQGYRGKSSAMVPFFGIPAPTNVAISRFARISNALVVPFYGIRLPGAQGYRLVLEPALENFPSGDPVADALRLNKRLEERIRLAPEQYLWSHDRFKVVPRD